jgi:DNA-binding response OmpR family regulator
MRSVVKKRRRGRQAAMTYVPKPFSPRQLLAKIRQYLQ